MEKSFVQELRDRMTALTEKRSGELAMVAAKREAARKAAEKAEAELADAVEKMDEAAYVKASQAAQSARAALEMYGKHYETLAKRELIPEAESDAVIDELLDYEKDLAAEFVREITGPLTQLEKLCTDYRAAVREAEGVLTAWQQDIHRNYRSFSGTLYVAEDGSRTNRSSQPVPVRRGEYLGCAEASQVREFLGKILPQIRAAAEGVGGE